MICAACVLIDWLDGLYIRNEIVNCDLVAWRSMRQCIRPVRRGHIAAVDLVLRCGSHDHPRKGRSFVVLERVTVDGFFSSDQPTGLIAEESRLSGGVQRLEWLEWRSGMRG